ncbi:MAG: biotin/lipoyl-binding protein [Thaumarchaeota archaeon]|nr:biotin/lipoyl-binding protein [Nitrososphaerota archaeon]
MVTQLDGRKGGGSQKTFSFYLGDKVLQVTVKGEPGREELEISVGGKTFQVKTLGEGPGDGFAFLLNNKPRIAKIKETPNSIIIEINGSTISLGKTSTGAAARPLLQTVGKKSVALVKDAIQSRIPGKVVKVMVKIGQKVSPGENLVILESMKMEAAVQSDREGTVKDVRVKAGDSVSVGTILVILE